jgi:hypothetical protein
MQKVTLGLQVLASLYILMQQKTDSKSIIVTRNLQFMTLTLQKVTLLKNRLNCFPIERQDEMVYFIVNTFIFYLRFRSRFPTTYYSGSVEY